MVLSGFEEEGGDRMRTQAVLDSLPDYSLKYLKTLRFNLQRAKSAGNHQLAEEFKAEGRGYIKCLEGCGTIDRFETLWCWFTL